MSNSDLINLKWEEQQEAFAGGENTMRTWGGMYNLKLHFTKRLWAERTFKLSPNLKLGFINKNGGDEKLDPK